MLGDPRTNEEFVWCIHLQTAASYSRFLTMDIQRQRSNAGIHGVEDIKTWAIEMTNKIIARANALVARSGPPGSHARSVAGDSLAQLAEMASSGYALIPVVLDNQPETVLEAARAYWKARRLHEEQLGTDLARTEAHNELLWQMDLAGIEYEDREQAAQMMKEWL